MATAPPKQRRHRELMGRRGLHEFSDEVVPSPPHHVSARGGPYPWCAWGKITRAKSLLAFSSASIRSMVVDTGTLSSNMPWASISFPFRFPA